MSDNDPLYWLIAEALQQLGPNTDAATLTKRIQRLQIGLPAEDEFSVLLTWLGRCQLVHKLDQLQSPRVSRDRWAVPDLLAIFDYEGRQVPVLIEVKTTPLDNDALSWRQPYRDALMAYARMLGLPLLVAWRFGTFWALFDAHLLTPKPTRYKIQFAEALKHTLMTELAGDFSFSLRPGCGMHFKIRKLQETPSGFDGQIEEAYWLNVEGERFSQAPGVFPLFLCLNQESVIVEDGPYVTQSFVIPEAREAEFAHRALATLLRFATRKDDVNWRRVLEGRMSPPVADGGLRAAADAALEAGFLQYGLNIVPTVLPPFLAALKQEQRR